ncbi:MAG: peptidoglycan bridge formation glycyltransferase FemA/FemB family protein [Candidatus Parcubacteria bacterium]|nr:peptidoglycan bridge formation glycyltransferase FemA/FemB family protein [Candidatus Parcubacteria bacterium]
MLNFSIKEWDETVVHQTSSPFSQSWAWAEFQKRVGRQCFFIKNQAGQALLIKYPLPLDQNYLYAPRGPILDSWQKESFLSFLPDVRNLAAKEKSIFWRFDPPILSDFCTNGARESGTKWSARRIRQLDGEAGLPIVKNCHQVADVQPPQTIILDLLVSEEEMLSKMHYKTRYNIRLAERHQIKIREGRPEEIEHFIRLLSQTSERDDFRPHPANYYRQMLIVPSSDVRDFSLKLLLAEYQGKILVANLVVFFGDTVIYLHGASADEYKSLMAPHLLQWETIKMAKARGYHYYDFWGIDEKKWPGVTRFKRGFAGQEVEYPGTFDFVFNPVLYAAYKLSRKILRRK